MDREEVSGLVGRKVAVRLNSFEARGLELVATLDEAREDGIVLSEIGKLGQRRDPDPWFGIPEPKFEISDGNGRTLPWSPRRGGSSDGEADGDVLVADPPDAGDLEVEVPRVVYDAYEDGEYRGDGPSYEGSWAFRFTL